MTIETSSWLFTTKVIELGFELVSSASVVRCIKCTRLSLLGKNYQQNTKIGNVILSEKCQDDEVLLIIRLMNLIVKQWNSFAVVTFQTGLESDMSSCFSFVTCNDSKSVNFSTSQHVLSSVSADDGDDNAVTAGIARVKPNAESFMQELDSCLFFFYLFCIAFACYEILNLTWWLFTTV